MARCKGCGGGGEGKGGGVLYYAAGPGEWGGPGKAEGAWGQGGKVCCNPVRCQRQKLIHLCNVPAYGLDWQIDKYKLHDGCRRPDLCRLSLISSISCSSL